MMGRILIIVANVALLILLVIGLPAAARARLGDVQISFASTNQKLIFAALTLAVIANLLIAKFLIKQRPLRHLCWEWAAVFAALLLAFFAFTRGYLHFAWLTRALQWLQKHL
jgi:hypothetical protein